MWATSEGPRLEDFGITPEDLARAPRPVLSSHRTTIVAATYLLATAVVFALILRVSHSLPAAAFFTVITLAAGSVLLLPVVVLVLCVGERAEERWLCRRVPVLGACLAYRRALAEHRGTGAPEASGATGVQDWAVLSHGVAVQMVRRELDHRLGPALAAVDREATGFDFVVELEGRRLLLRCEPGPQPVQAAVGRELVAALADHDAGAALILAASGSTQALREYISGRPIAVVSPSELHAAVAEAGFASVREPSAD